MSNKIAFTAGLSKSKKIYEFSVFYILLLGAELYLFIAERYLLNTDAQKITCPLYPDYCIIVCFNESLKK